MHSIHYPANKIYPGAQVKQFYITEQVTQFNWQSTQTPSIGVNPNTHNVQVVEGLHYIQFSSTQVTQAPASRRNPDGHDKQSLAVDPSQVRQLISQIVQVSEFRKYPSLQDVQFVLVEQAEQPGGH